MTPLLGDFKKVAEEGEVPLLRLGTSEGQMFGFSTSTYGYDWNKNIPKNLPIADYWAGRNFQIMLLDFFATLLLNYFRLARHRGFPSDYGNCRWCWPRRGVCVRVCMCVCKTLL